MSEPIVVLNVNDDAATRYLMSKILRSGGYHVVEAADGESALRAVTQHRPSLVLLDIKLPDISGLEVCRRLKSDPATATVLVIQTSATFSSSDRRVEGLDSGADHYLAQPIEAVELLATVRAVLRTRRAEEGERRAGRRLQRTFDAIDDGLLLVDVRGTIEECNGAAARIADTTIAELIGQSFATAMSKIISHEAFESLCMRAKNGRHEIETTVHDRTFRVLCYPMNATDGSEGNVLLIADVTAQRKLERELSARVSELAETSRRKDEFLGMLAHELRNPLHAISAATNVLDHASNAASSRPRDVIHRQLSVLARLVDDLLEVSRMTRGALQLRKRPMDLSLTVRQAVQGSRSGVDGRRQQLTLSLPDEPFIIEGDDLRLEQVLMNLIANASKFSEPGSAIAVDLRERWDGDDRIAELSVRDHGLGIPRDMLRKIFDPFVQVDQSLARSLGGLGIGLSMARSLVELHGGSIFAKSEGIGKGSEVVVYLPAKRLARTTDASLRPSAVPQRESELTGALRVVVVEDNEDTLELVQLWLRNLGYVVEGANDGTSGLELMLSTRPDVALVDIGLPGLDGYEVARTLRASAAGDDIYLVAVTGYGRPEDRARALDAGFDAYIVKPLDVAALRRALEPRNVAQRKPRKLAAEASDQHG